MSEKPENRWSKSADDLEYTTSAPVNIPTSVWVVYADTDYATEQSELRNEFTKANDTLAP